MSMISSLIDELRKSEDEWNGSNMFELARMCREAADTIWELRDDLQRANDENAKLRELAVLNWEWAHSCCGNNCKMQTDGCGYQIDRECNYEREIYDRMRDLGIEVDE